MALERSRNSQVSLDSSYTTRGINQRDFPWSLSFSWFFFSFLFSLFFYYFFFPPFLKPKTGLKSLTNRADLDRLEAHIGTPDRAGYQEKKKKKKKSSPHDVHTKRAPAPVRESRGLGRNREPTSTIIPIDRDLSARRLGLGCLQPSPSWLVVRGVSFLQVPRLDPGRFRIENAGWIGER